LSKRPVRIGLPVSTQAYLNSGRV